MSGLFGTLNTARSGMMTQQGSISVTSHNISNVNTPGYTRQKVNVTTNRPYSNPSLNSSMGPGQIGQGSKIESITRVRNTFSDFQYRSQTHNYQNSLTQSHYYTEIENAFNEPSEIGISNSLDKFFNNWHELSKNSDSNSVKNIIIQQSKELTDKLNTTVKSLEDLKNLADKDIDSNISQINTLLSQIKNLDSQIKVIEATGKNANDLSDKRDALLDELSFKIDLKNNEDLLVDGEVTRGELDQAITDGRILSGEMQGLYDSKENIDSFITDLNDMTKTIATTVNDTLRPTLGIDFFVSKDGNPIDGSNITVNNDLLEDPSKLSLGENTSDLAIEVSKIKEMKFTIGGKNDITITSFYGDTIERLGFDAQQAKRTSTNLESLLSSIDQGRISESGVSMDEEFANLIQFQRAYQANAKVVATLDQLLEVVVNGLVR